MKPTTYTFVEVTKNAPPTETHWFLVPVGSTEAVEEMRRWIAKRETLTDIKGGTHKAAHMNPRKVELHDPLRPGLTLPGRRFAVDGTIAELGDLETVRYTCGKCGRGYVAEVEKETPGLKVGHFGFPCRCGERLAIVRAVLTWRLEDTPHASE